MVGLRVALPLVLGVARASIDLAGFSFAKETPGFLMKEVAVAAAPAPTAAPVENILEKRGTNTCGFISGDALSGVTCRADLGAECLYDNTASAIGCCATENCNIWTACLDYTESDKMSTADMDRTRWCSDSSSAYCAIYDYQDEEWNGYTMHLCTTKRTTYDFYFTPEGADEDDVTTIDEEDDITTTSSDLTSVTTTTDGGAREPTTTSDRQGNEEEEEEEDDGGAPVGAIVGGTIGGVAVLALVGLAIFFILRRRKKTDAAPPSQPPMAGMYPNQPQYPNQPGPQNQQMYSGVPSMYMPPPGAPQQGYLHPGAAPGAPGAPNPGEAGAAMGYHPPQDNGASMKPPASPLSPNSQFSTEPSVYNPSVAGGMPVAAPPPSTSPPQGAPTPPNQGPTPPPGYGGAPAGYPQQGHGYAGAVELPTGRPDGELRELA